MYVRTAVLFAQLGQVLLALFVLASCNHQNNATNKATAGSRLDSIIVIQAKTGQIRQRTACAYDALGRLITVGSVGPSNISVHPTMEITYDNKGPFWTRLNSFFDGDEGFYRQSTDQPDSTARCFVSSWYNRNLSLQERQIVWLDHQYRDSLEIIRKFIPAGANLQDSILITTHRISQYNSQGHPLKSLITWHSRQGTYSIARSYTYQPQSVTIQEQYPADSAKYLYYQARYVKVRNPFNLPSRTRAFPVLPNAGLLNTSETKFLNGTPIAITRNYFESDGNPLHKLIKAKHEQKPDGSWVRDSVCIIYRYK